MPTGPWYPTSFPEARSSNLPPSPLRSHSSVFTECYLLSWRSVSPKLQSLIKYLPLTFYLRMIFSPTLFFYFKHPKMLRELEIPWINKVLLYSTGNYIQYPVINNNWNKYEKDYVTESLCYTHIPSIYRVLQWMFWFIIYLSIPLAIHQSCIFWWFSCKLQTSIHFTPQPFSVHITN